MAKMSFDPAISQVFEENPLYALREKNGGKLINVALSMDGIKFSTNSFYKKKGKRYPPFFYEKDGLLSYYCYYEDARPKLVDYSVSTTYEGGIKEYNVKRKLEFPKDAKINTRYVVEYPYRPRNHSDFNKMKAEFQISKKGLKLIIDPTLYLRAADFKSKQHKEEIGNFQPSGERNLNN